MLKGVLKIGGWRVEGGGGKDRAASLALPEPDFYILAGKGGKKSHKILRHCPDFFDFLADLATLGISRTFVNNMQW